MAYFCNRRVILCITIIIRDITKVWPYWRCTCNFSLVSKLSSINIFLSNSIGGSKCSGVFFTRSHRGNWATNYCYQWISNNNIGHSYISCIQNLECIGYQIAWGANAITSWICAIIASYFYKVNTNKVTNGYNCRVIFRIAVVVGIVCNIRSIRWRTCSNGLIGIHSSINVRLGNGVCCSKSSGVFFTWSQTNWTTTHYYARICNPNIYQSYVSSVLYAESIADYIVRGGNAFTVLVGTVVATNFD